MDSNLPRAGLLNGSFIPSEDIRELRDLTRYRKSIVQDISSQKNRIEKYLQSCGFKLSNFLSDIFGKSGRAIIDHLAEHGSITAEDIDSYVKSTARNKLHEIGLSVNGRMKRHQRDFLKLLLKHLDEMNEHLMVIEEEIDTEIKNHARQIEQLDSIPGIDKIAASAIIAEIGTDMSKFKTAENICSWAGLSPGNNESAGKKVYQSNKRQHIYKKHTLRGCMEHNSNKKLISLHMVLENKTASWRKESHSSSCQKVIGHNIQHA